MKKTALKLALISACFAFTVTACSSNKDAEGASDSDSMMMETDTMMTDTMGTGTMDTTVMGTDTMGTGTTPTP